jgi:hypothetical protein
LRQFLEEAARTASLFLFCPNNGGGRPKNQNGRDAALPRLKDGDENNRHPHNSRFRSGRFPKHRGASRETGQMPRLYGVDVESAFSVNRDGFMGEATAAIIQIVSGMFPFAA